MAATSTSRMMAVAVAAAAVAVLLTMAETAVAEVHNTSVWDAYPATMISMCPHIPRNEIDFDKLNGRWYVMEKGGLARPGVICEMDFHVTRGTNLTLDISSNVYEDQDFEEQFNTTWTMSHGNVWRDNGDSPMYMFVGLSTARSLLLMCVVDDYNDTHEGYSYSLSKEPNYVRKDVLKAARLPGNGASIDRSHCPE